MIFNKKIIAILFICSSFTSFGQLNRTKNWVVGDSVLLNFNVNPTSVGVSALESFEGYSVISDTLGNLLFYTNGISVWNSNHQVMPNGWGLNSNFSATNAALIVPKPGNDSIYYIFTVGQYGGNQGGFGGTAYTIVDISLNGGLGDVVQKNTVLFTKSTEKLSATYHQNGIDFWIMTHDFGNSQFRAFLLTQNGITSPPVISKVGAIHYELPIGDWGANTTGSMRFSPSGCRLALVLSAQKDTIQIFNFDKSSGYVFNPLSVLAPALTYGNPYLLCFSPDNSKLYVSGYDWIFQFDVSSNIQSTIQQSKTIIATNTLQVSGTPKYDFEDLQIAPDGKIYVSRMLTPYLSCIASPNNLGTLSNFVDTAIVFPGFQCKYGLPNFVSNFVLPDSIPLETCIKYCPPINLGNDIYLCDGDTLIVDLDLPQGNILWNDSNNSFSYPITESGNYIATYNFNGCPTTTDTLNVYLIKNALDDLSDTTFCLTDSFSIILPILDSTSYSWSNGILGNEFVTEQPSTYILQINKLNCTFYDTITITSDCPEPITYDSLPIVKMPNIFTPNNDGFNDLFKPLLIQNIKSMEVTIFNRWGNVVFHNKGMDIFWDGKHNKLKCSEGTYFYLIQATDFSDKKITLSNYVTLIY